MALDEPPGTDVEALSDSGMCTEEIPGIATPTWITIVILVNMNPDED